MFQKNFGFGAFPLAASVRCTSLGQEQVELISFGDNRDGRRDLPKELRTAAWTSGASRQRLRPSVEVLQVAAGGAHTLYLVQERASLVSALGALTGLTHMRESDGAVFALHARV
eukprot:5776815-Amphidinium_carterae.1